MKPVVFIGAGPGAADLITLRGAQRLAAAEVVLFDALTDPALENKVFSPLFKKSSSQFLTLGCVMGMSTNSFLISDDSRRNSSSLTLWI